MPLLGRYGRTVFNLLPLRGRKRRLAKLLVVLLVSGMVFAFGMSGMCMLDIQQCGGVGEMSESLQRTRDQLDMAYELKQNPGPFRNIKGGHSELKINNDNIPDSDRLRNNANRETLSNVEGRLQIRAPPPDDVMHDEGLGVNGVVKDDKSQRVLKSDDPAMTGTKSDDRFLEADRKKHGGNEVRNNVDSEPEEIEKLRDAMTTTDGTHSMGEALKESNNNHIGSERDGKERMAQQPHMPQQQPQQQQPQQQQQSSPVKQIHREVRNVFEEGNELQKSLGQKPVVMSKPKTEDTAATSQVVPAVAADAQGQSPQVKAIPKQHTVHKDPPELDPREQPSLPPEVVAVPKERVIVNDGGRQQEGVARGRQQEGVAGGRQQEGVAGGTNTVGGGSPTNGGMVKVVPKGSLQGGGGGREGGGGVGVGGMGGGGGGGREGGGGVGVGGMGGGGGGGGEERQMNAGEMARAIESGEMCKTVCPPFTWSEWSPCSKACGRGRRYRKAMYKFICQSSELCPLNRIEETVCETPCKFDPAKYGGPNGLDMYPINPLNPAIYPEEKRYMCGHWLVEYEQLHQDILSGKKPPRYLVYSTGKGTYPTAGGIAPRLKGITTAFFLAVLLDRAFMIEWQDPPGLDLYLEPKSFNWADLSKLDKLKRGPIHDIGSWRSAKESGKSSQWYMSTNFSTYFENEVEIVQGHRYDFTYAVLRNPELMPKAFELGVDRIKCRICCAFHMLFRMTEKFQHQMDELLSSLGAPKKTIGAIQIRTKSHNVQEAVKFVDSFMKCATKAGKGLKMSGRISWVPIFNNRLVVHIVHKKYGDKLKIPINIDTATRTVHTHLGNLPADTEVEVAKAVQERTFKEFFLTINSTVLLRRKGYEGSFGNIADAIRRFYHDLGTVHTFLVGNTCTKFPDTYKIE